MFFSSCLPTLLWQIGQVYFLVLVGVLKLWLSWLSSCEDEHITGTYMVLTMCQLKQHFYNNILEKSVLLLYEQGCFQKFHE